MIVAYPTWSGASGSWPILVWPRPCRCCRISRSPRGPGAPVRLQGDVRDIAQQRRSGRAPTRHAPAPQRGRLLRLGTYRPSVRRRPTSRSTEPGLPGSAGLRGPRKRWSVHPSACRWIVSVGRNGAGHRRGPQFASSKHRALPLMVAISGPLLELQRHGGPAPALQGSSRQDRPRGGHQQKRPGCRWHSERGAEKGRLC